MIHMQLTPVLSKIVPYPYCILITLSHKTKLWKESANDEAIGIQRKYEQIGLVNRHQGRWVGCKRRLSLWSTGRKDHGSSGGAKSKPQMAQSIIRHLKQQTSPA